MTTAAAMALFQQIWTLMRKNLRRLVMRHYAVVFFMALLTPVALSIMFCFVYHIFVPPSKFGVADPRPIMPLSEALRIGNLTGRSKLFLVNNGHNGGDIDKVLDHVFKTVQSANAGVTAHRISHEKDLVDQCRSTFRGRTKCFNAVAFHSSPHEGVGGVWNYTIRTDSAFHADTQKIKVDRVDNIQQVYMIPTQHVVDSAIVKISNPSLDNPLSNVQEKTFTSLNDGGKLKHVLMLYHRAISGYFGVAFMATIIWVSYHMAGFIATEREKGMSQLIDAMMLVRKPWMALLARMLAHHWSFSIIYAPAWIMSGIFIRIFIFPNTNIAIILSLQVFGGLSFASMSIFIGSFFKKAQLSGATSILSILLLGILAQTLTRPGTRPVVGLSTLFPPCAYVYAMIHMSWFERYNLPASLSSWRPESSFQLHGFFFWLMLVIQTLVYPMMGAAIEWKFTGTSTKGRSVCNSFPLPDNAVQLHGFTKMYPRSFFSRLFSRISKSSAKPILAVDNLSLNAGRGQIVCLLGANGSGKSSTLGAIAGLNTITNGSISISVEGTGGLGIAPQQNVLWDDLNVTEHLRIFGQLKSPNKPITKEEIDDMIKTIDLWPKRDALSHTLSGGQKRKLQLGMMLIGGSSVCCVDEVSSGVDPLSRRKLWEILLSERGMRTIILTTHFLDEADLLADHIAILSKGTLRAQGSSAELKDKFGGGYRVHVAKTTNPSQILPDVERVTRKEDASGQITYVAPSSTLAGAVIEKLQEAQVQDYRISSPTIEDVFLQLAEEMEDEEASILAARQAALEKTRDGDTDKTSQASLKELGLKLLNGQKTSIMKQVSILFSKRHAVLKINWPVYVTALLMPIFAAGLTSLVIQRKGLHACKPDDVVLNYNIEEALRNASNSKISQQMLLLAGPRSSISASTMLPLLKPIFKRKNESMSTTSLLMKLLRTVDTYQEFDQLISKNSSNIGIGLWLGDNTFPDPVFAWSANLFASIPMLSQQLLNVVKTNTTIATSWSPFDKPYKPGVGEVLNLVIYMGIALSVYPSLFALYPSNERRRSVRAMQYSNGVRPFSLWLAYLAFDSIIVLVGSASVTGLWAAVSDSWFGIQYIFVVLFLYGLNATVMAYITSLYTKSQLSAFAWPALIQLIFMLSYLVISIAIFTFVDTDSVDSALRIAYFIMALVSPMISAMRALFLATNLFSISCQGDLFSSEPQALRYYGGPILYLVLQFIILFAVLLWLESDEPFSWPRKIFSRKESPSTDLDIIEQDILGGKVTDSGHEDEHKALGEKVIVSEKGAEHNGLRVMHLTKSFGKLTAVDNVSFDVKRGEIFALLGPNGAGKSTTISLIRGDEKPSQNTGSTILVEDASVSENLALARRSLGVCPQIDAIDQLTVRGHLEFYAKVRGVPDIQFNVKAILAAVGLEAFEGHMGDVLSGGNKRKLGLGIALMGNPSVLLLDEPSSGLDAASKRIMWRTLRSIAQNRSILFTTHSMEEADALAGRVGIIARRMLALGTPEDLCHRFGDLMHVHLVARSAPRTPQGEIDTIVCWIRRHLPNANVDPKTYHGQVRFTLRRDDAAISGRGQRCGETIQSNDNNNDNDNAIHDDNDDDVSGSGRGTGSGSGSGSGNSSKSAVGNLVIMLEANRMQLGISHYSILPTGLDQVFLSIVGKNDDVERDA